MNVLKRIEKLRSEGVPPNAIEVMLLDGRLGNIGKDFDNRCYIGDYRRAWLVMEAYNPGFIQRISSHPNIYVVHHKDEDTSNDAYNNLQLMKRTKHTSLHWKNLSQDKLETIKTSIGRRSSSFWDNVSKESREAIGRKISESKTNNLKVPNSL